MKFSINYNAHSSAMSPGSGVWLEGSGREGRLGTAAGGSAVVESWRPASTALSGGQAVPLHGSIARKERQAGGS